MEMKVVKGYEIGPFADLQGANLRRADLTEADLEGANLDHSCWPLSCGSLGVKLDERLKSQLLYHMISVIGTGDFPQELIDRANKFHRVGECPELSK